jgi:hypothetical protein
LPTQPHRPLRWIYDVKKLDAKIAARRRPLSSWIRRSTLRNGSNTCYGDQAYLIVKFLVAHDGFDVGFLAKETFAFFSSLFKEAGGNASVEGFLDHPDCGSSDSQVDCACKIAPLVALTAGYPDLLPNARAAVRYLQKNTGVAELGVQGG